MRWVIKRKPCYTDVSNGEKKIDQKKKSLIKLGESLVDEGLEMKATIPEWFIVALVYNIQQDGHFSQRNY